jgi:UTP--glucose-1-phosphate uridylyltransferase
MRPATRTVPKPLIPVLEKPAIQYVVEEAVAAGAQEVVFVLSDERILHHFTSGSPITGLENTRFRYVEQEHALGLGHAVLCAAEVVGNRPFTCLLSDRFPLPGSTLLAEMVDAFDDRTVLALERVTPDVIHRYGVVSVSDRADGLWDVHGAVEKPAAVDAPSDLALVGRYVFTPDIFADIEAATPGALGEIQLTDAIDTQARRQPALGVPCPEDLLDTGLPLGLAEATAAVALGREDIADEFRAFLHRLLAT